MPPKTSTLLSILVTWVTITAVFPTLIVYRATVDPVYQWGLFGITGVGMSPGFAVIVAAAAWAWTLVVLGQRQAAASALPLVGWNAFLLLSMVLGVVAWGPRMELRGDAYGLRLNLATTGPLLTATMLVLSVIWLRRVRRSQITTLTRLPRRSRRVLVLTLGLTPIIALLFALSPGAQHTDLDRIAVALTIVQCITITSVLGTHRAEAVPTDPSAHT